MAVQRVKGMTPCCVQWLPVGEVGSVRQGLKESRGRDVKGGSAGAGRAGTDSVDNRLKCAVAGSMPSLECAASSLLTSVERLLSSHWSASCFDRAR
jgi:hypothetical protein